MRRILYPFLLTFMLAGCAGVEYRDNTAEVAGDPRCMDKPSTPGQASAPWCKPETGASWTSGKSEKVDLGGKQDD